SRHVLDQLLCFKLTGRLVHLLRTETGKEEAFTQLLKPHAHEHFVDLGAYNGDTIRELLHYTGGAFASLTALEPDRRSMRKLKAFTDTLTGSIQLVQAGAWREDCELPFAAKA